MQTKRLCRSRPLSAAPAGAIAKKGLACGTGRGVRHHKTSDTRRTGRRRLPDRALNPAAREINSTSGAGEPRQQESPVFAGNPYRHEARMPIVNQNGRDFGLRLSFLGRGFFRQSHRRWPDEAELRRRSRWRVETALSPDSLLFERFKGLLRVCNRAFCQAIRRPPTGRVRHRERTERYTPPRSQN